MAKYRTALPQLEQRFFVTDGGLETTLIFLEGQELPQFAAFVLLNDADGEQILRRYYQSYADLAVQHRVGLLLDSATWRASPDWAEALGYDSAALARANKQAIALLEEIRRDYERPSTPIVISGCVGPRGDGYEVDALMSADEARAYHSHQIGTFAQTQADLITALTLTYVEEAIGLTQAAREAGMPVAISFTVETDGRLPSGQNLGEAIEQVDQATSAYPAYFMVNCAHPSHFESVVDPQAPWAARVRGLRANASRQSHEELDAADELDVGQPLELAQDYAKLRQQQLPELNVMGGCCGTDQRHIQQIATACAPLF